MTDDALVLAVTQAQRGDARAFDALVRQFQHPAIAYARTLLFDPAAAEDAAQEAFVQAWRDLPRLSEPAAFRGWLRRIVFKFCDRSRRSARPTLRLDGAALNGWVRGERHSLACESTQSSQYELALPLWEANAASGGQLGGWGWLLHAATLWQVTQSREQTLALLREARANDDRDMLPLFASRPEFANVQDDAEYRQSISRKQPL